MARRPCTVEARKVIRWLQERDDMIRRGVRDSPLKWLFLVAVFVHAIPLLIVEYVPSVDLPNHVLAAAVAINSDGFYPVGPLAFDWVLSPYILFTALMVVLLPIFGAIWATKIVLLAYVIGLPLSVLAYLRAFNRNNWPLAFMVFPFVYSYHFEYGFIQYCLGIPLVFLTLSVCKNVMDRIDSRASVLLAAGLAMAVYLSHWVNFLAFLVGFVCLIVPLRKRHDLDTMPMPRGRERVSVLMKGLAIITPPLVLFAIYLSQVWSRSQGRDLIKADLHYRSIVWQLLEPMRTLMSSVLSQK